MKDIFVIDNYDSFTYNLVHLLEAIDCNVTVRRNDQFELDEISPFEKVLISPGPGIPDQAGKTKEVIKKFSDSKSILGVCLGHQAIAEVFGGSLKQLEQVYHGVSSKAFIVDKEEILFKNLSDKIEVGRYHSWTVDTKLPQELKITAVDEHNHVMALKHINLDVKGIQFHPESILTQQGKEIIKNWVLN